MELVYLWVEDYKNIHQQGFNFSPRFECSYKNDTLTIDPIEHISIFPKNINITAIVGKNGSGKSSLFEELDSSFGKRFYIIFSNNKFEVYTFLDNIIIRNNTTKLHNINKDGRFPQVHFSWDILHYEPVLDWASWMTTNPNILLNMLGTFSHPEYIDLTSYQNNSVIKYIEIFSENKIDIFTFSPNKINIKFPMKKNQTEWNFEKIKEEIEKLKFPEKEAETKKNVYFKTISEFIEKYLGDGNHEKNFTLKEYYLLLNELEDMKEVLSRFPSFILDIYDNDISFFGLSHGERSILLSNALLYESAMDKTSQDILICLDEPDLSLHPEWQKKYINELIKMFSQTTKNFHFLITSHSPFILSDIPKENVIFLKNGKQDKTVTIDTFGANIHTLLSHGFFMNDGLMGEFAKGKINEILNFHKIIDKKRHLSCLKKIYIHSKQTQFWHIQKIIGEEYLKQVIKNHLTEIEKILLGKEEAKNAEIRRVEAYLTSLKND